MKILAHISDLHFGREDLQVAEGLVTDLHLQQPHLVINSGDFTQRARKAQYLKAAEFMKRLPQPQLFVPGNHDIPLFDVARRFWSPLKRYKNYLTEEMMPFYQDDDLLVIGLNTARSFTWKNGRISLAQIEEMERVLSKAPRTVFKIVVTHHPFIPPPGEQDAGISLVGRAQRALDVIERCGVDLLISGHLHHGYTGDIRTYYPSTKRSILVVQAGTAISHRIRGEPNGYNIIMLKKGWIEVQVRQWVENKFTEGAKVSFRLEEGHWIPQA
ncbi:metallophosphoesterase family protein [Desulfonatronum parangueonense]